MQTVKLISTIPSPCQPILLPGRLRASTLSSRTHARGCGSSSSRSASGRTRARRCESQQRQLGQRRKDVPQVISIATLASFAWLESAPTHSFRAASILAVALQPLAQQVSAELVRIRAPLFHSRCTCLECATLLLPSLSGGPSTSVAQCPMCREPCTAAMRVYI